MNSTVQKAGATVIVNLGAGLRIDKFSQRTDGVGSSQLQTETLGSTIAVEDGTGTLQTQSIENHSFRYATRTGREESMPDEILGLMPVNESSRRPFQLLILLAILLPFLQSVSMPTIISAAEQEMPRRHSLTHLPAVESGARSATILQGTILQPGNTEPTHHTSPIGPPEQSMSTPPIPSTHHQPLAKRRAIASTTARATSSPTSHTALTTGVADGPVAQPTADSTKNTPPATAPIMKSTAAPLAVVASTDSAAVASTAASQIVGAASIRSAGSAASRSAPSSGGSRSALKLLQNSAITSLLKPSIPVVSTPPLLPPSPTSPSTPPLPNPSTGNATLTWMKGEPEVAGYKIYIGTDSGTYSFPGSPFVTGNVASFTISNLPNGQTYFFAISAYDSAGNESPLSAEVIKSLF